MTYEEAKIQIQAIPEKIWDQLSEPDREAMEMAFSALQAQDSPKPTAESAQNVQNEDLILRKAAIDALIEWYGCKPNDIEAFEEIIEAMQSAQSERKKGKWIKLDMHAHLADHKCTACGQECYVPTCMGEPMYTYCPNCGADMREDQDG